MLTRIIHLVGAVILTLPSPPALAVSSNALAEPSKTIALAVNDAFYQEARRAFFDFSPQDIRLLPKFEPNQEADIIIASNELATHSAPSPINLIVKEKTTYALQARLQDQLMPAVLYACQAGVSSFVLMAGATQEEATIQALTKAIEQCGARVVRRIIYKQPLSASTAAKLGEDVFSGFLSIEKMNELEAQGIHEPLPPPFEAVIIATENQDELLMLAGNLPYGRAQLIGGSVMANLAKETLAYGGLFGGNVAESDIIYDAMALALTSCQNECGDAEFLTKASGFKGKAGLFRLTKDGSNQRMLPTFRLTKNGIKKVAKAEGKFATSPPSEPAE